MSLISLIFSLRTENFPPRSVPSQDVNSPFSKKTVGQIPPSFSHPALRELLTITCLDARTSLDQHRTDLADLRVEKEKRWAMQ
jgi:hypothetical protein